VLLVVGYNNDRSIATLFAGVSTNIWRRTRIVTSSLF